MQATGLLAYRYAWDPGPLSSMVEAAVAEGDAEVRRSLYEEIQREYRDTAPFAIILQKTEQIGRRADVENLSLDGVVTAVSY